MNGSIEPAHPAAFAPATAPARRRRRIAGDAAIARAATVVGFERLTVQAVARELGVAHSSLYKHVSNRDDLVRLAVQRLVLELPPPSCEGGVRSILEREAWTIWDLCERHPGLAEEMAVQSVPPAAAVARGEAVEALLRASGLDSDAAILAVDLVVDLAFDVAIRSRHIRQHHADPRQLPPDRVWFARKLAVVLAGVDASLIPRARQGV